MYAIGHFALAYFAAKGTSRALKTTLNLPLLLALSVLPDVDLILGYLTGMHHRVITHSIITYTIVLIPFLYIYGKRALPYYAALLTHSLVGDFVSGGLGFLWPITDEWFGLYTVAPSSTVSVAAELTLFAASLIVMIKTRDIQSLLKPSRNNLLLIIAFGALLGPLVNMGVGLEGSLPLLLWAPSLFWLCIFGYSVLSEVRQQLKKHPNHLVSA